MKITGSITQQKHRKLVMRKTEIKCTSKKEDGCDSTFGKRTQTSTDLTLQHYITLKSNWINMLLFFLHKQPIGICYFEIKIQTKTFSQTLDTNDEHFMPRWKVLQWVQLLRPLLGVRNQLQFPHLWHVAQFEARCKPIYRPNDPWVEGANLLSLLIEQQNSIKTTATTKTKKKHWVPHQPPPTGCNLASSNGFNSVLGGWLSRWRGDIDRSPASRDSGLHRHVDRQLKTHIKHHPVGCQTHLFYWTRLERRPAGPHVHTVQTSYGLHSQGSIVLWIVRIVHQLHNKVGRWSSIS